MKVFKCDRCGAEVPQQKDLDTITWEYYRNHSNGSSSWEYEVCTECAEELWRALDKMMKEAPFGGRERNED